MMIRLSCRSWWSTLDASCPGVRKVVTEGRHSRYCMEKSRHKSLSPFGEKVLGRKITTDQMNRMNPKYQYGVWLGMRNNSAECFIGMQTVCSELTKFGDWNLTADGTQEQLTSVVGVPWRMTDGRWTVDRPEAQVDPTPIPPLPFKGARIQRERITKKDVNEFGATVGCAGCNAIRDNKRAQAQSDRCRMRMEERLITTPHGAEKLERRDEVINEALAEEVRREEQRKKRNDRAAAEAPETGPTAPAVPESREDPIEASPNPKRRLLMKSASLTASSSGQQREGKAIPDDESGIQVEDKQEIDNGERAEPHRVSSTSIRRRMAIKSEPRAVTTQEAVDGYREKAMRIESVEQIELGNIMELSITGHVLRWARRSNLSGGVSLRKADGWNVKNHSHLTVAKHLREKMHPACCM